MNKESIKVIQSPHIPVLPRQVLSLLSLSHTNPPKWILDGTAGEGGHSKLILETFPGVNLLLIDRDATMLERALANLQGFESVHPFQMNFSEVNDEILQSVGCLGLDGVLVDLGVSLFHFLHSGRGFTFKQEEPLDMRLEPVLGNQTAADILNYSSVLTLKKIFWDFGEERWALKIANNIVQIRQKTKFQTNLDLAKIVEASIPRKFWPKESHPATKVFQALRIAVNEELVHAEKGIRSLSSLLVPGGVIACISFHSLEDRIVKWAFRDLEANSDFSILTKKPMIPEDEEIRTNRASRSAKLRGLQRDYPILDTDEF